MRLQKQKGVVNQLSSPAETTPVVDTVRDQVLADVQATLGAAVVDSLVKSGDDIWIRVSKIGRAHV